MTTLVPVPAGGNADDVLDARFRAGFDKLKAGRAQWIEGTLEVAAVVLELRQLYPDHREFSRWIDRRGLPKITPNARTALCDIAKDPTAARTVLEQSTGFSWEWYLAQPTQQAATHPYEYS